jgi:hypothetical protein
MILFFGIQVLVSTIVPGCRHTTGCEENQIKSEGRNPAEKAECWREARGQETPAMLAPNQRGKQKSQGEPS